MSPEQARGETVDHRSDLFSLGCVFYAMSTGRSPFRAATAIDAIRRVCDDTPRPIREINPEIPDWLVEIIDRLLAKDRERRFQSASEVANLLGDCLAHLQRPADLPKPSIPWRTAEETHGRRSRKRRIGIAGATLVILLTVVLLANFAALTQRSALRGPRLGKPNPTPPPQTNEGAGADSTPLEPSPGMGSLAITPDQIGPRFPTMRVSVRGNGEPRIWNVAVPKKWMLPAGQYRAEVLDTDRNQVIRNGPLNIVAGGTRRLRVALCTLLPMPPQPAPLVELPVRNVAGGCRFSPDGNMVAVPCYGDIVEIWNSGGSRWQLKKRFDASARVRSTSFSPDGNLLAAACDNGTVDIWNLAVNQKSEPFSVFYREPAKWVAFSPDGQTIASASTKLVRLWDCSTGEDKGTIRGSAVNGEGCAFSADGTVLAACDGTAILLWDVAKREELRRLRGHTNNVQCVAFCPDGHLLASSSWDCTIKLWDIESGLLVRTLRGHRGTASIITSLAFSPDGATLASGDWGQIVCLWEVANGSLRREFHAHWDRVSQVSFLPDGNTLATSAWDHAVRLWSIAELPQVQAAQQPQPALLACFGPMTIGSDFCPKRDALATLDALGSVALWRMTDDTWTKLDEVEARSSTYAEGKRDPLWPVVFSSDGRRLATVTSAEGIRLWQRDGDTIAPTPRPTVAGDYKDPRLAISPDGQTFAVTQAGGVVKLLHAASETIRELHCAHGQPSALSFSPDGSLLAVGTEAGSVLLWDRGADTQDETPMSHGESRICCVAFSSDGSLLASTSEDGTVKLWDVAGRKALDTLPAHPEMALCAAFSPDGQILATGGGHVDFDDDDWFLTSFGGQVKLWDVASRQLLAEFKGHEWPGPVLQTMFLGDSATLLTRGLDLRAKVWDISRLLENSAHEDSP
jgi:WD40 repeat protein